nr:MAG TPA: hypothetical protein [Caudoviricetes sp.]
MCRRRPRARCDRFHCAVECDRLIEKGRHMPYNVEDIKDTGNTSPDDVAPIREVKYDG